MPISQTDQVFSLIKSLSKAEKRNFTLYSNRLQGNDSKLFMQLFELMDKQKTLNEKKLVAGLGGLSKVQYSNVKRHLYTQVITSLRLIHKQRRSNIQVRELLDFAYILYGKGLYPQSLKLLQMGKRLATKHHLNYLHLTIIEFEKFIESRHITRSKKNRDKELIHESLTVNQTITKAITLSNLRLRLHGKYVRYGHIRNDEERKELITFFNTEIVKIDEESLGVMESVFLCQSYVWYYYILLDFDLCLKWAQKWVQLLEQEPEMQWRDIDLFLRGCHYVVTAAYLKGDKEALQQHQAFFENFRKTKYKRFNFNSQILAFLYVHTGRLNNIILQGNFKEGVTLIPSTLKRIHRYGDKLDAHQVFVLYYKIAWIYLGNDQAEKALDYLNMIVNKDIKNLRQDIQGYAKLLFLICHYEMSDYDFLSYLIRSFKSYFKKKSANDRVQLEILNCLQKLSNTSVYEQIDVINEYLKKFEFVEKDIYTRRSVIYLDIVSWLRAKQLRVPLEEVVKLK